MMNLGLDLKLRPDFVELTCEALGYNKHRLPFTTSKHIALDLSRVQGKMNLKTSGSVDTDQSFYNDASTEARHPQEKNVAGIINCAINKNLLGKKGIGVTEYLSKKCNIKNNSEVMLIKNSQLAVCPLTTHLNLSQISKQIKKDLIVKKVITINNWYKSKLRKKPEIAILGLNPHNAEYRKNSEEIKIIIPAIKILKKRRINVTGPLVADTIFINDYQKYDVVVGMYHDQVLAPFKGLYKYDAINITLGLKYLRLSPDHGTAFNLIKKNKASPLSLIRCLEFIKMNTR